MSDEEQTPEYQRGLADGQRAGGGAELVATELMTLAEHYHVLSKKYESADYFHVCEHLWKLAKDWEAKQ